MKKKIKIILGIFCLFIIFFSCAYFYKIEKSKNCEIKKINKKLTQKKKEKEIQENIKNCILSKDEYNTDYYSALLKEKINNLNVFLDNSSSFSLIYKELNENLSITKNENEVFYGASIIKTSLATYIYEKSENDNSILETEIKYNRTYYRGGAGLIKNNIKSSFKVRELVKLMIEESDNIAFSMLYRNFDISEVKTYFSSLGATYNFSGSDMYGNITANDCKIYLEELNQYFQTNTNLANELKTYYQNASKNSIIKKTINKEIYFKYGESTPVYHEIAITNEENPYIIIILTNKYPKTYSSFITDISLMIEDIHNTYYESKSDYCNKKYVNID